MRSVYLLLGLLLAGGLQAHEVRPAYLKITELEAAEGASRFQASFRQPQLQGRFLDLRLGSNCEAIALSAAISSGALIEVSELRCVEGTLERLAIIGLERTLIDTLVSIDWLDGETTDLLIAGDEPTVSLATAAPALPVYLVIGVEHLLLGYDHVLFLIMLLYLVRKPLAILVVVTSFTLAHSLTLGLAAMGVVGLSSAPVEAVIAASIVLLAWENLRRRESWSRNFPALIAFGFGLLHGLGFAGALAEIGLPEGSQLSALFLFNLGIELGQLLIIGVVVGALALLRPQVNRLLYEAPLYLGGGIASFWFLQRSWQIVSPALS